MKRDDNAEFMREISAALDPTADRLERLEYDVRFWQNMAGWYDRRAARLGAELEREFASSRKALFPLWWQVATTMVTLLAALSIFVFALPPLPGSVLANVHNAFAGAQCPAIDRSRPVQQPMKEERR
jgi:hypothetical protein